MAALVADSTTSCESSDERLRTGYRHLTMPEARNARGEQLEFDHHVIVEPLEEAFLKASSSSAAFFSSFSSSFSSSSREEYNFEEEMFFGNDASENVARAPEPACSGLCSAFKTSKSRFGKNSARKK